MMPLFFTRKSVVFLLFSLLTFHFLLFPTLGFPFISGATRKNHVSSLRISNSEEAVDIDSLEKQVIASARAKLDAKQIRSSILEDNNFQKISQNPNDRDVSGTTIPDQWKIALAAGAVGSLVALSLTKNVIISAIALIAVFFAANGDPLEENNLAGALARVVGRFTLRSVEASQPKVKALARAVVTGEEEIVILRQKIKSLETENEQLKLWKERRIKIDQSMSKFPLGELKDLARQYGVAVGGTKSQLLLRLVEAELIEL